mgnify:CR=1 FL=1
MLRISDIKLGTDDTESDLRKKVLKLLGVKNVKSFEISKKSIDARKKPDIHYVYSVDVETDNEEYYAKKIKNSQIVKKKTYEFPKCGKFDKPVVIVGTGPAGLMCGLTLAQNGYKVILLERGKCVEERMKDVEAFWEAGFLNPESNVQFGEGGAGTFSDGKLTTGIKDFRIRKVLEEFHKHGAPKEILYYSKPHVGTDNLSKMVASIRSEIRKLGGEVRFSNKLVNVKTDNGEICGAVVDSDSGEYVIETNNIVLAIGHSARDTFEMLYDLKLPIEAKPFSVGARIEHLRQKVDKAQYGRFAGNEKLGSANYKLNTHLDNGRGVYTFCMCPGGMVVNASSEENKLCTNGMSEFARDAENSNSALLVGINPDDYESDHPLAGMYLQRKLESKAFVAGGENYNAPIQRVDDFLNNRKSTHLGDVKPSIGPNYEFSNLNEIFPEYISTSMAQGIVKMGRMLHGFDDGDTVLTGVESRSSSPVRIMRKTDTLESVLIEGLYPCGEGAGYAGGIISAAVDGIKCAEKIIEKSNR